MPCRSQGGMSDDRRRYARFYYERFIAEYPEVYDSDALLAGWLRCLVASEQAWPNDPELPRLMRKSVVASLVELGVIQLTGHRFHLRGYTAERLRRSESGRKGAAVRWHSDGNANALLERERVREQEGEQGLRPSDARARNERVDPVRAAS